MTTRNLEAFFAPRSIAVIGASRRTHAVGAVVAENLMAGGFQGPIMPVNPHSTAIGGVLAYKDVESLPLCPDLAVIATPAGTVPDIVRTLGRAGCRAAVVLSAGFESADGDGGSQRQAIRIAARESDVRIIGPNCLGIMSPPHGVNASFAHAAPLSGRIACVMQSGAMVAAILDWAGARGVGFSKMISLGDAVDVDFGDLLNYLALDPETDAILLYIEGLNHARKFMTAARAAARLKPVIALKAGRNPTAANAVKSHTGALAGSDRVYDVAFQRAGIVRVDTLDGMFDALEVLGKRRPITGERLAIVTNGGGAAVLAADRLYRRHGILATLSPETIAVLDSVLPVSWPRSNPIDLMGDADGGRYAAALQAVSADPGVDAILVINCPTAVASSEEAANSVIDWFVTNDSELPRKPVLAAWLGTNAAGSVRNRLSAAGIPTFATPEHAVDGIAYLQEFQRRADRLLQLNETPEPVQPLDRAIPEKIVRDALTSGREWLDEDEAKRLLAAYGVPVARTIKADTPDAVGEAASLIGKAVAVKIRSRDITHKTDVGGVMLDLATPQKARAEAQAMRDRIAVLKPDARIEGFTVNEMIHRPAATELIAGLTNDATFGPVLLFGQGGVTVDAIDDTAVALPPLTSSLADELIARTRVSKLLRGYRGRKPADMSAIREVLLALARMATEHPEIAELDINPLLADDSGVIALDARIRLQDPALATPVALTRYPHDLERTVTLADGGAIAIRPIRPEDARTLQRFIEGLDAATVRARFFETMKRLSPVMLVRLTQVDYDREIAFVAIDTRRTPADGDPSDDVICGVGRVIIPPVGKKAIYALTASPEAIARGVARALMDDLIAYARNHGMEELCGDELADSTGLVNLVRDLGATVSFDEDDMTKLCISLSLMPPAKAA